MVLSISYWRAIGSPEVMKSPTTLKAFDGWGFQPHGLLPTLLVELECKTVSINVEVVDAPLDYNLLLGRNWFYAMIAATSIVFRNLQFPHMVKIVTIYQLDYCMTDVTTPTTNNIPILGQYPPPYQLIGICMLKDSTLMGVFLSSPPST